MKRINDVLHQLTDSAAIMQELKETLREVDPSFRAEEDQNLIPIPEFINILSI